MLKSFIKKIDCGYCDNMNIDQLDKLIRGFELIEEVEKSVKPEKKKIWRFGK